ncbi:integration host factor subunit beta [Aurantiacibacter suaedae]|uniref:integration host factor subunit beta n=1 Tax=Aurantiacibacter suaedae TaxID=2545755 RepID=UPI00240CE9AB|nr:integration host factor subunit beta [Aurantiacibacter suaedae]
MAGDTTLHYVKFSGTETGKHAGGAKADHSRHKTKPFVSRVTKEVSMIRSELLQSLAEDNPDLRAEEVEQVVDLFFDEIAQRLSEGGRVELRGFGTFSTRQRDARSGRNPRTGDSVDVPAKKVPYFKPGKEIRERLNAD